MKKLILIILLTVNVLFASAQTFSSNNNIDNNATEIETEFISFNIYPNPSKGYFSIKMNNGSSFNLAIYAMNGALVYNQENIQDHHFRLDISNLVSKGIYHVRINQGKNAVVKKLVIQ
jgi:hypothetical protein